MLMRHYEPLPKIKVYQDIEKQLVGILSSTADTQLLHPPSAVGHEPWQQGLAKGQGKWQKGRR